MKATIQNHIMHDSNAIAIYCGTYKKYNNGSIDGAWLDLSTFKDAAEFFDTCKELHDDEAEPEYMFQDYQNFPQWLYKESMGAKEVQEIINFAHATDEEKAKILCEDEEEETKPQILIEDYSEKALAVSGETYAIADQLKKIGAKWNRFKKVWFISKKKRTELEELVAHLATGITTTAKAKDDESKQYKDALADFCKAVNDCGYYAKERVGAVKIRDRYLLLDKPAITTKFWFHDDGPNYELYKEIVNSEEKMKQYFIDENLNRFQCKIDRTKYHCAYIALYYNDNVPAFDVCLDSYIAHKENLQQLTDEEVDTINKALTWAMQQFSKRLETYLKRYGTSKLDFDTYWADR